MFDIIVTLVKVAVVVAIVAAIAAVAIKLFVAALPVILVIGGILLVVWFLGDGSSGCSQVPKNTAVTATATVQNKIDLIYRQRDALQSEIHDEVASLTAKKSKVNLSTVRPELDSAILVVVSAFREILDDDNFIPLITSADDYEGHAEHSAHYAGAAVDFRIKDIGNLATRKRLAALVKEYLDGRFLVLHEDIGTKNEHLHVQMKNGTYSRNVVWR